uniref:Uncharacterized protein n=1 Tax=Rhizophora mucronata TaxID=61149 RepID=A0A2P2Q465_RHIMU
MDVLCLLVHCFV